MLLSYLYQAHMDWGRFRDALDYGHHQLGISEELDNAQMRSESYLNLARAHEKLGEFSYRFFFPASLFFAYDVCHTSSSQNPNSAHTPENWGTNLLANVIISRLPRAFTNVCETLALQWVRGAIEKRRSRSSHRRFGLSRARRLPEMLRGNWVFQAGRIPCFVFILLYFCGRMKNTQWKSTASEEINSTEKKNEAEGHESRALD